MQQDYYSWDRDAIRDFISDFSSSLTPKQICDLFIEKTKNLLRSYGKDDVVKKNLDFFIASELHNLANNPNYRDHLIHSINVFLLGHYIFNVNSDFFERKEIFINESVDRSFNISTNALTTRPVSISRTEKKKIFNFSWLVASLLHDLGYICENLKQAVTELNIIKNQFPFLGYRLIFRPKLKIEKCQSALDLLKDYFKQLNKDEELNEFDFSKFLTISDKKYRVNHGISSAITYLNNMIAKQRTQNWMDTGIYLNYINWGANRAIALAMALHDLPKLKKIAKREKIDNFSNLCKLKVKITKDPLTVFLILCDSLQDWDRERVFEGFQNNEIQRIELTDINCFHLENRINLDIKVIYYLRRSESENTSNEEETLEFLKTKASKIKKSKNDVLNHIDLEGLMKINYSFIVEFNNQRKEYTILLE